MQKSGKMTYAAFGNPRIRKSPRSKLKLRMKVKLQCWSRKWNKGTNFTNEEKALGIENEKTLSPRKNFLISLERTQPNILASPFANV